MSLFNFRPSHREVFLLAVVIAISLICGALVVAARVPLFLSRLDVVLHQAPATASIPNSLATLDSLGATYRIPPSLAEPKVKEFDAIHGANWDSSRTELLSSDLLQLSIKENAKSGAPDADLYQRYNYVVKDGSIRVAVWTVNSTIAGVCKTSTRSGNPAYQNATIKKDVMVNFFPEDKGTPGEKPLGSDKVCMPNPAKAGVLDAHSKHFMLAQTNPVQQQGGPEFVFLKDYDAKQATKTKWQEASVEYAGEILVDVRTCSYIINSNSGTFRPNPGSSGDFKYLLKVAKLFENKIGVSPIAVWDTFNPIVPTTRIPESGNPRLKCA